MKNICDLQLVTRNETSTSVLKFLSNTKMTSNETSLESFKAFLTKRGYALNGAEFLGLFKELEEMGVGKVYYDGQRAIRFVWAYNVADVAAQILSPNSTVELQRAEDVFKEQRAERKGASVKSAPGEFEFFLADGSSILLTLDEAEQISVQARAIKGALQKGLQAVA